MDVVDHHAIRPDLNPEDFRKVNQPIQKQFLIRVFPENRQTGVAATDHMVTGSRRQFARGVAWRQTPDAVLKYDSNIGYRSIKAKRML